MEKNNHLNQTEAVSHSQSVFISEKEKYSEKDQDDKDKDVCDTDSDSFEDALDNLTLHTGLGAPNSQNSAKNKSQTQPNEDKPQPSKDLTDTDKNGASNVSECDISQNSTAVNPTLQNEVFEDQKDNSDSVSESGEENLEPEPTEDLDFEEKEKHDSEKEADAEDDDEEQIKVDEDALKERDAALTPEQLEELHKESQDLKGQGNEHFKSSSFEEATEKYTQALLACPVCHAKDRSIMYSNRAAAQMRMEKNDKAIADCSKALELNPNYLKALLRRAELYQKTEKLDEALADYQRALEMDPSLLVAREACVRLPEQINERNEKMKTEMMSKLKDLGNLVLRPFGLSTNNFNLQQDPNTGSYSVQFQQNAASEK